MLTQETLARFDREIAKYPAEQKQSAVMACLTLAQVEKGWLAKETIAFVADYLDMPAIAAEEVATFYNMYNLKPVGKYKLAVCTCIPCALSGGRDAAAYLADRLGIKLGETTADGRFTLVESECQGACGDAPVALVNNHQMKSFLTPDKLDQLLEELK
ncbi:NADH-quinone oxidoreductase subunit E [Fluviibacter phosphoraccumulans]|uniref:NADH-quinone oxidoreductase subunit NuoE n=1 Tax=Fluviibacter phosphoraccumulans TaxID=1751046 RepID=UPI001366822A|nr:NADH-quinone oxidoreductase subunit NuoE [Fluviibacter phosphoraccumulans]BBU71861.1 NADH-quinone oxidoreductase subunit E [Fluviibacter phosphoraccumulans]